MSESVGVQVGSYRLKRSRRRTLAISVLPDGQVEVTAPMKADRAAIEARILRRAAWIARQQRAFAALRATRPGKRHRSGATHRYLGRQYRLRIRKGPARDVTLRGGFLHVTTPAPEDRVIQRLLSSWLRKRAVLHFGQRLSRWKPWCLRAGLPEPRLVVRAMSKRWGSSHADGRIVLNPELLHAAGPCIDYVIAHEVCHLRHPRHDRAFYAQLGRMCPRWRLLKQRLEASET